MVSSINQKTLKNKTPSTHTRARKLPNEYVLLASKRGFSWLGPEVSNAHLKTNWKCQFGHQWSANYNNINSGKGCPYCAGVARKTPDDYHKLAKQRGFYWVGEFVNSVLFKTTWKCNSGHKWLSAYSSIQQGAGCPHCAGNFPKSSTDFKNIAYKNGIEWVGSKPVGARRKTEWKCQEGHIWSTDFGSIERGYKCPFCSGHVRKNEKDYVNLANQHKIKWVGKYIKNARYRTEWECSKGHRWTTTYGHIKRGNGCPHCSGKAPKNEKDYYDLAKIRGFSWVGPMVRTVVTKTGWECKNGHYWKAVYSAIQQGSGCPICVDMIQGARVSKIQRRLHQILGGELNKRVGRYNIDIALTLDGHDIAVEYDSWYWHKNQQKKDDIRTKKLLSLGWKVIRIKSNMKLPELDKIMDAIEQLKDGVNLIEIELTDWGID